MSTLTNWLAINRQIDSLPPTEARTVLNWILSFERALTRLDIDGIMSEFEAHVQNYDNPHEVTLDQLTGTLTDAVWSYYSSVMAPTLPTEFVIPDETTFKTYLVTNPMMLLEIVRDSVLNGVYQYQDLVGPRATQPFYTISDYTKPDIPSPLYYATGIYPDNTLVWNNTSTRVFSDHGLVSLSVVFGFRIVSYSTEPAVWKLALNNDTVVITYVSSERAFHFTFNENYFVSVSANNITMPINPSGSGDGLELRGVLRITPKTISLLYGVDGVLTTTTVNIVSNTAAVRYQNYTLSHVFWDNQTDVTATTHLGIYAKAIKTNTADLLMSRV